MSQLPLWHFLGRRKLSPKSRPLSTHKYTHKINIQNQDHVTRYGVIHLWSSTLENKANSLGVPVYFCLYKEFNASVVYMWPCVKENHSLKDRHITSLLWPRIYWKLITPERVSNIFKGEANGKLNLLQWKTKHPKL